MVDVPTRTLRAYLASLPDGGAAGVVSEDLTIRNDLVTNVQALPAGGMTGQVLAKLSDTAFDVAWTAAGNGDMLKVMYDPQLIEADAFARANHTGTQPAGTITGLAPVATSGAYSSLSGLPPLGTASAENIDFFVQPDAVQTLTNKRITQRVFTVANTATLTPNADSFDLVHVTAQAGALTIAAPTGTPTDGQVLKVRIRDNGTSRALTWNGSYAGYTSDLPASTVISMTMAYEFWWNAATSKWDLVAGNPIPGKWGP